MLAACVTPTWSGSTTATRRMASYYYTMDYITGETLATRLERGHLAPREVVRLGLDLLAALDSAHRHEPRLIHRDIKPSNIFLGHDRAMVGDFGVARAIDASATALTQSGELVGTLAYISPEQLRQQPVTEQTDIYAVGLVLYEAATGRRWPPLDDPTGGHWSAVPPHLRSPIRHALQLKPKDRWPAVGQFAAALASAERAWRMRWMAGAAVAAGVAGLILYMIFGNGDPPPRPRDLAVFPFATVGLADSSLGSRLAGLTGWSL